MVGKLVTIMKRNTAQEAFSTLPDTRKLSMNYNCDYSSLFNYSTCCFLFICCFHCY